MERHSVAALVNSLLREWPNSVIEDNEVVLRNDNKALNIALESYSSVGSHDYINSFLKP